MVLRCTSSARRTGGLALLVAAASSALVAPASAQSWAAAQARLPVRSAVATCVGPGEGLAFGGASVVLDVRAGWLGRHDVLVLVPVDDATGLDAGERTSAGRRSTATVVVPADGTAPTPASTVEVRLGGTVLQRIPVAPGCGVLDPTPERGPVLEQITAGSGAVAVQVRNAGTVRDDVVVTLTRVGSNVGDSRGLALDPGQAGTVRFSDVAAGTYTVEAFGYVSFRQVDSEPFSVG